MSQGCRKQSADGQAQLDVGGEATKNSAQSVWQNLDLAIISSQEVLSLHFSFKLGVSYHYFALFYRTSCIYVPDFTTAIQSGNETTPKSNT